MITKVLLENFRSFERRSELTMISSNKIRINSEHRMQIKSTRLLRYAVVYGANASGKTNLVEFFRFFLVSLNTGLPSWSSQLFCKNHLENKKKESIFEIQFSVGSSFYAYGFSAVLFDRKITSEWLYELYQNGSSRCIFQRDTTAEQEISTELSLSTQDKKRFATYSSDFSENYTSLFLAEMNRNKKITVDSKLKIFQNVFQWLKNNIFIYTPNAPITDFRYYYNADSLKLINSLITTFDTGISNIRIDKISMMDFPILMMLLLH